MFGCVLGVSEVKNWNDLYNIVNIQVIFKLQNNYKSEHSKTMYIYMQILTNIHVFSGNATLVILDSASIASI